MTAMAHAYVGFLVSIAVGIVALILLLRRGSGRSARAVGWLLVAAIIVGWASWWTGDSIAFDEGPAVSYTGRLTVTLTGALEASGTYPAQCESVVGEPGILATVIGEGPETGEDLFVLLRPTYRGAVVPRFSATWTIDGRFLVAVGEYADPSSVTVVERGLSGTMTLTDRRGADLTGPGDLSELYISVSWQCSPPSYT
jgi:hypothetical protein